MRQYFWPHTVVYNLAFFFFILGVIEGLIIFLYVHLSEAKYTLYVYTSKSTNYIGSELCPLKIWENLQNIYNLIKLISSHFLPPFFCRCRLDSGDEGKKCLTSSLKKY